MADLQIVYNEIGQAEYEAGPFQQVTNIVAQAEFGQGGRLEIRWICAQAEYGDEPLPGGDGGGLFFAQG